MIPAISGGLTSIIVPCCNQGPFTRLCVQALPRSTRPAWELIAVDSGSADGTRTCARGPVSFWTPVALSS